MRTAVVCVALVAGAVFAEGARAASVGTIEGDVLVNRGDGYRTAKGTIPNVPAGTQLMVRPGGSAIITYSGNCAVRIAAGVWSVNEQAPCADGRDFIDFTGRGDRPVLNTRPAPTPPPVTETASINRPASEAASMSGPEAAPHPETRVAPPVPSEGIGQPYSTVYRTSAGEAPPPEGAYRPPPPPESDLPPDTPPEEQSGYQTHHYLIMGGLVAAGIGGAAVLLSQGGDDAPASPE
jgi:hypothetical protein